MKHLMNNLSIEEKNRIREQHEGGMKVDTSKFRKLMESKLGNSKPLVSESGSMYSDFDLERMNSGEDMTYTPYTKDLKTKVMDLVQNDSTPNDEIISILRTIADEMESSNNMKGNVKKRFKD